MIFEKIRERLQELCEQTYYNSVNGNRDEGIRNNAYHNAIDIINQVETEYNNGWIPFTQRKLTDEEKQELETEFDYILDCDLPDNDTEIIVCYKGGYVGTDTFFNDCGECWLDSGNDFIEDAIGWQPLPKPYIPVAKNATTTEWQDRVMNHFTKGE